MVHFFHEIIITRSTVTLHIFPPVLKDLEVRSSNIKLEGTKM